MRTKFKNVANLLFIVLFASCNREGIVENDGLPDNGKIAVATEIIVDGVEITTRAASEAGYTTGDGLYDKEDKVTVAAFANDGYELTAFYDKKYPSTNLGSSYNFSVSIPQTFKAEFARRYTISVSASPSDGGTVTGGGKYKNGASCTLTATPNGGYAFDGWYEGSTKVSSNSSYSFTVSSNRTVTARFVVGIADNVLNAYLGDMVQGGGGDFYIEIEAYYPLKSDINIKMGYQVNYWSPGAGSIFTDGTDKAVLKTGEKSFKVRVHVGTGGWFDGYDGDVNWYFDFTHFSDSSFRYLKGSYNGVGYPS